MILACCCMFITHAQEKGFEYSDSTLLYESPPAGIDEDSNPAKNDVVEDRDILSDTVIYINHITIASDSIVAWKNNKRFAYVTNLDSLLKIRNQEMMDEFKKASQKKPNTFLIRLFSSGILQVLFWGVAIAFVLFILYKLFLSNGIFKRNATSKVVSEVLVEEVIATVADYDRLIHESLAQGDHRMAVRYLFLRTLVDLADKEYLHYSADKTNYQYVQEIRIDKRNEFASLVLNYEYIWYGNFPLTGESYAGVEKKFNNFYSKIQ